MSIETPPDNSSLLPWYLNGTLHAGERREVEVWLRDTPGADGELALWRAVQQQVRSEPLPDVGSKLAWRQIRGRLPGESSRRSWMAAAAASLLLVAGLQTAILLRDRADEYRPLSERPPVDQWLFHVVFDESATLASTAELLERYGARIVDGPSALGLYTLAIPREPSRDFAPVLERLRAEPLVLSATAVP